METVALSEPRNRANTKIGVLFISVLVLVSLFSPLSRADAAAANYKFSAESMTGGGTVVTDPTADGLKAVDLGGMRSVRGINGGFYTLTAHVLGTAARVKVRVSGGRVVEQNLNTKAYTDVTVPVKIDGPWVDVDISNVAPGPFSPNNTVRFDYIKLTPDTTPTFTTRGGTIYDPTGKPFTMRGLQPLELSARPLSDADADAIRDWGANTVRIVLSPEKWLTTMCQYDPNYQALVDDAVNKVNSRGMLALLELSTSTNGEACGTPDMQQMADNFSIQFWGEVATHFKDNPWTAFDLYNEPHDIPEDIWRWGGNINTPDGKTFRAAGMQQLINTVRITAGADNLVTVSGLGFAYDIRVAQRQKLQGYNIVLASHVYCLECGGALRPDIDQVIPPLLVDYPVTITEFGWNKYSGAYQKNLIDWAEANHVGWSAFQFTPFSPRAFGLFDAWGSYQPNVAGVQVRNGLWAARGWTTPGGR